MVLPQNTLLGKLEIVEVYEFYDQPLLFVCRSTSGNLYLVVLEDDDDDSQNWFYVAISRSRFEHIRSGFIDFYTAFSQAEDEQILEININKHDQSVSINTLSSMSVGDDRLPTPGESISLKTPTLPQPVNIDTKVLQTRRNFINLSLHFAEHTRTEAPAKALGSILEALQDVITMLGFRLSSTYTEQKQQLKSVKPTKSLSDKLELMVVGVGAGSFIVELASNTEADMFGDSLVTDAMQELTQLLKTGSDIDRLKKILTDLDEVKVAKEYLDLLNAIVNQPDINAVNIEWASLNRKGSAQMTAPAAFEAITALNVWEQATTEELNIRCILIGLNIRTRRFEVEVPSEDQPILYAGHIPKDISVEAWEVISNSRINQQYKVTLREETTYKIVTEETFTKYNLISLDPID